MSLSLMPNITTEEQAKRLKALLKIKEQRHDAIVRFVNEHEEEITVAIELAMKSGHISDEKEHCTEDSEEATMAEAFSDRLEQWSIANHKMMHFMATGTEDAMFPHQS